MVSTRSLAATLLSVCAVATQWRSAEGVKACTECANTMCIVEDTSTKLTAGSSQLSFKICNYDAAAATKNIEFKLKASLACDTNGTLTPKLKSLAANGSCNGAECPITATLESPIDWAVVMRSGAEMNAVMATFKSGGSAEVVTIANGADTGGAAMQASSTSTSISVCSSGVAVSALRLSQVDGCNTADICRGKATDAACSIAVKQGLPITGVTCDKENCSGKIVLSGALTCDAALGDSNALIVAVKVGNSAMSNYQSIGSLAAPKSVITDVSGLAAGSEKFSLSTDSFCPASAVQVNLSNADGSVAATVASVNTTNSSVAVTLSSPLASTLDGKKLAVTLTQCSAASESFASIVGADDGSSSSSDSGSDDDSEGNAGGASGGTANGTGAGNVSTQENNLSTGLPGGMIVGIAVGVVALLGFVFECWYHKRRQTPSLPSSSNDAPVSHSYGQNAI